MYLGEHVCRGEIVGGGARWQLWPRLVDQLQRDPTSPERRKKGRGSIGASVGLTFTPSISLVGWMLEPCVLRTLFLFSSARGSRSKSWLQHLAHWNPEISGETMTTAETGDWELSRLTASRKTLMWGKKHLVLQEQFDFKSLAFSLSSMESSMTRAEQNIMTVLWGLMVMASSGHSARIVSGKLWW